MATDYAFEKFTWKVGNTIKQVLSALGLVMSSAIQLKKGADVASASQITLLKDGNVFQITGTTAINHITKTDWQVGSIVTLLFGTSVTVTHNAGSVPSNAAAILLAGAANLSATANDSLTLCFDGIVWREVARAVI